MNVRVKARERACGRVRVRVRMGVFVCTRCVHLCACVRMLVNVRVNVCACV